MMRQRSALVAVLTAAAVLIAACGGGGSGVTPPTGARVVELPGAAGGIDFDDIVYSPRLGKVLVPARQSGLYLVDPDAATAVRLIESDVASADEGRGLLFLADRDGKQISVVDPADGKVIATVATAAKPDYVRYVEATGQLWVTEPGASPSGIEIFAVPDGAAPTPTPVTTVDVPGGPEGIEVNATSGQVYTHAGSELVAIDAVSHSIAARWPLGCSGTHGFPRADPGRGVVLTSCSSNGTVVLLDLDDGHEIARRDLGGGESLPGFSARAGHFYARQDPGQTISTLDPDKLTTVGQADAPSAGHCLTADDRGHYWTCDADHGRILRYDDPG